VPVWVWTSIRISERADIEGLPTDEAATSKNMLKYLAPGGALEMSIENSMSMQGTVGLKGERCGVRSNHIAKHTP
jgi:hypothetical protein